MDLRCRLGLHKWKWAPYYMRTMFFSTFRYRYCLRCPKIQQVYEASIGHVLVSEISGIEKRYFTGSDKDKGIIISSDFDSIAVDNL